MPPKGALATLTTQVTAATSSGVVPRPISEGATVTTGARLAQRATTGGSGRACTTTSPVRPG